MNVVVGIVAAVSSAIAACLGATKLVRDDKVWVRKVMIVSLLVAAVSNIMIVIVNEMSRQEDSRKEVHTRTIVEGIGKIARKMDSIASYAAFDHDLSIDDEQILVNCVHALAGAPCEWAMTCLVYKNGDRLFIWEIEKEIKTFLYFSRQVCAAMMPYVLSHNIQAVREGHFFGVESSRYENIWSPSKELYNVSPASCMAEWYARSLQKMGISDGFYFADVTNKTVLIRLTCKRTSCRNIISFEGPSNSWLFLPEEELIHMFMLDEINQNARLLELFRESAEDGKVSPVKFGLVRRWEKVGSYFVCEHF